MSHDGLAALPRSAMGLSAVSDCDISRSYSLTTFNFNFEIVNFPFFMEMFLAPLHMVYTFLSLCVLQECVLMMITSTTETYF